MTYCTVGISAVEIHMVMKSSAQTVPECVGGRRGLKMVDKQPIQENGAKVRVLFPCLLQQNTEALCFTMDMVGHGRVHFVLLCFWVFFSSFKPRLLTLLNCSVHGCLH